MFFMFMYLFNYIMLIVVMVMSCNIVGDITCIGVLFNKIEETHENYDEGIKQFIKLNKSQDKLLCATHNQNSVKLALNLDNTNGKIEYAQLMGMSDNLSNEIIKNNKTVYKYLPYGNFNDTLPYLIRRIYENYPLIINVFK